MKYRIYNGGLYVKSMISRNIEQATRTARKQYGDLAYVVEDEPTEVSDIVDVGEEERD